MKNILKVMAVIFPISIALIVLGFKNFKELPQIFGNKIQVPGNEGSLDKPLPSSPWKKAVMDCYSQLQADQIDAAKSSAEKALSLSETQKGHENRDSLISLCLIARCAGKVDDISTAVTSLKQALMVSEKNGGFKAKQILRQMAELAIACVEAKDYTLAGDIVDTSLKKAAAMGIREPDIPVALLSVKSDIFFQKKQYDEAIIAMKQALGINEEILGPEHLKSSPILLTLGHLSILKHNYEKAETYINRALAIMEYNYDKEDARAAVCIASLAVLYEARNEYVRAEHALRHVVKVMEKNYGTDSSEYLYFKNRLDQVIHRVEQG